MSRDRLLPGIDRPEALRRLPREVLPQVVPRACGRRSSSASRAPAATWRRAWVPSSSSPRSTTCFETPADRLVLDVGHQGYPHKMLTGRREAFDRIGKADGIAKFLRRSESEYDHFGAGHAGTSISAALGMARAMQHQGTRPLRHRIVIGDGGMTAGMAFEALNHAGDLQQKNLVVVLNDNEMSISPNVGAMSSYLSRKLSAPMVTAHEGLGQGVPRDTLPGDMVNWAHKAEESLKVFFSPGLLFEALELPLRRADSAGQSPRRDARDLRQRARDAAQRRRSDPGARHHRQGLRLRARPGRTPSSITALGPSTSASGALQPRRSPGRRSTRMSSPTR